MRLNLLEWLWPLGLMIGSGTWLLHVDYIRFIRYPDMVYSDRLRVVHGDLPPAVLYTETASLRV